MPPMSGFDGTLTIFTGGTALVTQIEEWIMNQDSDIIIAFAKGDTWKTKFLGSSEWRAEVRSLVDDAVAASALLVNQALVTAAFIMKVGTTNLEFVGAASLLSNITTESPVDGPVILRATVTGTGALVQNAHT